MEIYAIIQSQMSLISFLQVTFINIFCIYYCLIFTLGHVGTLECTWKLVLKIVEFYFTSLIILSYQ